MAKNRRRIPEDEPGFNEWYKTFSANLGAVAATVEVSMAKVARAVNDSAAFDYLIERNNIVRVYKEAESSAKSSASGGEPSTEAVVLPNLNLPDVPDGVVIHHGIMKWANNLVQQIVENENCTPEIENFLNIELKGGNAPDDTISGEIKSAAAGNGGVISLKCAMQGYKGYRVYSMRGDEADFIKIGDSMQTEFTDDRPNLVSGQPEKRQYKVIMIEKNQPVGDYSDVKIVVTKP